MLNIGNPFKKNKPQVKDLYSLGVDISKKNELKSKKNAQKMSFNIFQFSLAKRQKILITAFLVFIGFIFITQTVNIVFRRYYTIFILGMVTYILSLWALWQGMTRIKAVMLMILPFLYCIAVPSFYFLFPVRWLTRLPMAIFFGLSFYWLLLSQNVFNVASERAIPLYRAASTVNFVYTIFTAVLLISIVYSINLPFYLNILLVVLIIFPLTLQNLWSITMEKVDLTMLIYAAITSLLVGEMAVALSFWNSAPLVISLYLSSLNYAILGILNEYQRDRLNKRALWEYIQVGGILFLIIFIITTFFS
jgi:hypothetical protein